MKIQARFNGICKACNCELLTGTMIEWSKGYGATHLTTDECDAAKAARDAKIAVVVPAVAISASPIVWFLAAAQQRGLRAPKARFLAPNGTSELRLSVSGARSRVPGSINVVIDGRWIGRICADGTVSTVIANDAALTQTLAKIGSDPVAAARAYGALMGRCSFCALPLTDAGSVEAGYGPICAKKFDLQHTAKGTPKVSVVS